MENSTYKHWLYLRPLTAPERKRKPFAFVALETELEGGVLNEGACIREGLDDPDMFYTAEGWLGLITSPEYDNHIWYIHYGGKYAFKYLIPALLDKVRTHGWTSTPIVQGRDHVIGFIIRNGVHRYELRDSFSILPVDWSDLYKIYDRTVPGVLYDDNADHAPNNPSLNRLDVVRDLYVLRNAVLVVDNVTFDHFGVHVGWTTGSTSLRAWRRTMSNHYIRVRPAVDSFARKAYYGGLMYVRDTERHYNMVSLDINACYAHAMRQGVPVGPGSYTNEYDASRPGIYRCTIYPDNTDTGIGPEIPFIPYRGNGQVHYSNAHFDTYLTSQEIEYAQTRGYGFVIRDGYLFDRIERPFTDYINKCEGMELQHKGTPLAHVVKLLRNSLYGKFGTRPIRRSWTIAEDLPEGYQFTLWEQAPEDTPAWDLSIDGLYWKPDVIQRSYMFPHWAAWIAASARINLMRYVEEIGSYNVYYMDTDSMIIPTYVADSSYMKELYGLGYGQLKVQARMDLFHARGPKHYTFRLASGTRGVKAAGMPKDVATYEGSETGKQETFQAQVNTLRYIANPTTMLQTVKRSYSGNPEEGDTIDDPD